MPIVAAIEDSEVLADVKVYPLVGWECPFSEVGKVRGCRDGNDCGAANDRFPDEDGVVRSRHAFFGEEPHQGRHENGEPDQTICWAENTCCSCKDE